jgi:hypothetical protein
MKELDLPAATFSRGCSLLIRIKSIEFKLFKLVESSIHTNVYLERQKEKQTNKKENRNNQK